MKNSKAELTAKTANGRIRRSSASTIKPIFLSTFLIVIPIIFYWYVQLQNQQDYEQDRIYRTLRELELHISKELNALEEIEKVLPLEQFLSLSIFPNKAPERRRSNVETPRLDHPCAYKLLENSQLKTLLNIGTSQASDECKWNDSLIEDTDDLFIEMGEAGSNDLPKLSKMLEEYSNLSSGFAEEIKSKLRYELNPLPKDIAGICPASKENTARCQTLSALVKNREALINSQSLKDILNAGLDIANQCEKESSKATVEPEPKQKKWSKKEKRKSEQVNVARICYNFRNEFAGVFGDFVYTANLEEELKQKKYEKIINEFSEAVSVLFSTIENLQSLVSSKINEVNTGSNMVEAGDGAEVNLSAAEQEKNNFIQSRIEPYQKIVASSKMCIFASDGKNSGANQLTLIKRSKLFSLFKQEAKECQKILEGDKVILVKKTLSSGGELLKGLIAVENAGENNVATQESSAATSQNEELEEKKLVIWLAVGVDSILKRYRQSLTYLQDIYLTDGHGRVLASFVGANKSTSTNTRDMRVFNLKPILNEVFDIPGKNEDGTEKKLGVVEQNEIGVKLEDDNEVLPSWPFRAELVIEGKNIFSMVKPTQLKLHQFKHGTDVNIDKEDTSQLVLVGLQQADQLNLLTDRLSPLFHLTVLFLALLLLLAMPVVHVVLSRKYNSYSPFSIKLFGIALSLSMVVSVVGFCSYLTMLKQNIYSADLMQKSAGKLIGDWTQERNAAISFLQNAENCLFEPALNSTVASTTCPQVFQTKNLTSYRNYTSIGASSDQLSTSIDSYVYDSPRALSMMGLVFYTDADGIKLQPDWMARNFVPIRNRDVDLSQRNYFRVHQNNQSWLATELLSSTPVEESEQLTAKPQAYFIERIYNYIDGRKVTQLSIPRKPASSEDSEQFKGVVSGEIMALSFESPVLPPGMRMAVIEKETGKVLFHTEKERVLVENFYDEMEQNDELSDAIRLSSHVMEMVVYRSKKVVAYAEPIPNSDWALVLLYDSAAAHGVVNEVAISVMIVLIFLLTLSSVLMTAFNFGVNCLTNWWLSSAAGNTQEKSAKSKNSETLLSAMVTFFTKTIEWKVKKYVSIVFGIAILFSLLYNNLTTETGLLVVMLYFLANFFFFTRVIIVTKRRKIRVGAWLRTNPLALTLFLLLVLGIPAVTLFIRWYNISTHQLQAYDYLQVQQQILARKQHINNYRNLLWYDEQEQSNERWLTERQQMLGMFADIKPSESGFELNYNGAWNSADAKRAIENLQVIRHVTDDSGSTSSHDQELPHQFLKDELPICLHHSDNGEDDHEKWRSIPPLGQLSHLAYHIAGQHCEEAGLQKLSSKKITVNVKTDPLGEVWQQGFNEDKSNKTHRMTRLEVSERALYFFAIGLILIVYYYARQLISGVWNRDWLYQSSHPRRSQYQRKRVPRHRLFISPEQGFVEGLMNDKSDSSSSKKASAEEILDEESSITKDVDKSFYSIARNAGDSKLFIYFNIDLVAMDAQQRQILLEELEQKLSQTDTIVWMITEVSPLYRLMKAQAYPTDNVPSLSQAEVLRWASLFREFYKDYDSGLSSKIPQLLRVPRIPQTQQEIPESMSAELNAFYPDLTWIWDVAIENKITPLNDKKARELCSIYAGPYYRFKWEECTLDERLVLYQIASGCYPSPKNVDVIEHLLRRGYIVATPFLSIANDSFKHFVLNAELQETFDEWVVEAEKSSWQQIRIYIGVIILLILAWLAYTSKDTYQQIAYIVGSLLTVFTALTQGANLLNLGKGSDSS